MKQIIIIAAALLIGAWGEWSYQANKTLSALPDLVSQAQAAGFNQAVGDKLPPQASEPLPMACKKKGGC